MRKYEEEVTFVGELPTETYRHQYGYSGSSYHCKDFSNLTASSIMKNQYRRERIVFQAIVLGARTREEAAHIANGERFKRNLFMVGDMCRVNVTKLSESTSVFTATNVYYIDELGLLQRIRHLLCKLRAAALRKMGLSEFVTVIVSDTGF